MRMTHSLSFLNITSDESAFPGFPRKDEITFTSGSNSVLGIQASRFLSWEKFFLVQQFIAKMMQAPVYTMENKINGIILLGNWDQCLQSSLKIPNMFELLCFLQKKVRLLMFLPNSVVFFFLSLPLP